MQAKNSNTTYTTLDISCPQRGADGNKETVFYSCYFNSFLADRLMKAGVKRGTGLIIIGDLEQNAVGHGLLLGDEVALGGQALVDDIGDIVEGLDLIHHTFSFSKAFMTSTSFLTPSTGMAL